MKYESDIKEWKNIRTRSKIYPSSIIISFALIYIHLFKHPKYRINEIIRFCMRYIIIKSAKDSLVKIPGHYVAAFNYPRTFY